jgi:hypothetical protein
MLLFALRKAICNHEEEGLYYYYYRLNMHAPLHSSNTTCFIVHLCYYFDIGDAVTRSVSGFPLQVSLLHRYILVPLKVTSAIVTIDQSLSILRTVKMILGASRLFLVYLPASSRTKRRSIFPCLGGE